MAVGALEPQFYALLLQGLEIDPEGLPQQMDASGWPQLRELFVERFKQKTREEWTAIFEPIDACVSPVLSFAEAPEHPHNAERETYVELGGVMQPAPAPRFSRTPAGTPDAPPTLGADTDEVLADWGVEVPV